MFDRDIPLAWQKKKGGGGGNDEKQNDDLCIHRNNSNFLAATTPNSVHKKENGSHQNAEYAVEKV